MWRFCPPYSALAQSDAGCLFFCNSLTYSTYVKPWKFQSVYSAKSFFQFQIFRWMHRVNILYSRTWHALCYPSMLQGKPSLRDNFHETNSSELAAFCSYALAFPTAFQALVDTYDVKLLTLFLSAFLVCLGLPFCSIIALSDSWGCSSVFRIEILSILLNFRLFRSCIVLWNSQWLQQLNFVIQSIKYGFVFNEVIACLGNNQKCYYRSWEVVFQIFVLLLLLFMTLGMSLTWHLEMCLV